MNRAPRQKGFTLLEVMVSLSLIALLTGAVMSFLWTLSARQAALGRASAEAQAADTLFDRIEGDLLGGIAGDPRLGAGIDGTATRLRLLTRGVDLADGGVGDLQEAVFAFSGGTLSLSRRPIGPGAEDTAATAHPLADGLSRVRFRYFDGREWVSRFNSATLRRLPAAIEVELWRAGRGPAPDSAGAAEAPSAWPEPDRSRVIVIPDGPDAAWGGGLELSPGGGG